jgi:hypothetical protein
MADASLDRADRPASDRALSSDEEDLVSSQNTPSAEPEARTAKNLSSALGKLQLDTPPNSNQAHHGATRTCTPGTDASIFETSMSKPEKKKMELLDLPLDVLKEIVKEVREGFWSSPSPLSIYHNMPGTNELTYALHHR